MTSTYDFRRLDLSPKGLADLADLFRRSFGSSSLPVEVLEWQYKQNPLGEAVGFNAYSGEQLAAHYVTIPTVMSVLGRPAKGLLSINTATGPEHQGRGLFVRLAEMTYREGREKGFEFVVGVANHNSVHGFVKKLEFTHLGLLQHRLVLDVAEGLSDPGDLSNRFSSAHLAWRLGKPGLRYYYRRAGAMANLYCAKSKAGFYALVNQAPWTEFEPLLSRADLRISPLGHTANPLKFWLGSSFGLRWRHGVSLRIPQRLRPIPLNLIFRDLHGSRELRRERIRFFSHDFDAD